MGRAGSEAAMLDIETASASAVALPSPPLPPPPPWSVVDMDAVRVIIAGRRATSPAQRRSVDRSLLGPSSLRSATTTGQKSCMTSFSGQDAFQRVSASSAQGGHPEAGAWSAEGLQSLLSFPQSSHIIESMWASETVSRTCTTRLQEYLPRSCDCKPDHKIAEAMWLCLDSLANPLPRKVEALVNECLSGWVDVVESQMHRASNFFAERLASDSSF